MERNEVSDRTERAADKVERASVRAKDSLASDNVVHHDDQPSAGDQVGEAAGGISGVLAGAAIGSIVGPIGTVIGGIAGAIGGWWTGRAIAEAAANFSHADDVQFRTSYEGSGARLNDRSYDDVRPAFQLGYLASHNPDYQGREFEDVESELRHGWSADVSKSSGEWEEVRGFARDAYTRGRLTASEDQGSNPP
jgi:hypothetical protein